MYCDTGNYCRGNMNLSSRTTDTRHHIATGSDIDDTKTAYLDLNDLSTSTDTTNKLLPHPNTPPVFPPIGGHNKTTDSCHSRVWSKHSFSDSGRPASQAKSKRTRSYSPGSINSLCDVQLQDITQPVHMTTAEKQPIIVENRKQPSTIANLESQPTNPININNTSHNAKICKQTQKRTLPNERHRVRFQLPTERLSNAGDRHGWDRVRYVFDFDEKAAKVKSTLSSKEQPASSSNLNQLNPCSCTDEIQKTLECFTSSIEALNTTLNQTALALIQTQVTAAPKPTEKQAQCKDVQGQDAISQNNTKKPRNRRKSTITEITRSKQTTVSVRISFLKVGEIDTVKETFTADVLMQTKWPEPLFDAQEHIEEEKIEWSKFWSPKVYMENTMGDTSPSTWYNITFDKNDCATVVQKQRIKANFLETMELKQFPFDSQDLTVTLVADRPHTEVALIEDPDEPSSINTQSFVDEQEWSLHSHLTVSQTLTQKSEHEKSWKIPTLSVSGKARRRPGFFVWNVLVVMFLISALAFATFAVSIDLPQNRLQLGFTLVLTSVAFKFVANQNIPKISYLTYLDKYILLSMCCLVFICCWHAVISYLHDTIDESLVHKLDLYAMIVAASIFVLFHLVFLSLIYCVSVRRRVMYAMKDLEHERMVEKVRMKKERKKILANKVAAAPLLFSILQHARRQHDVTIGDSSVDIDQRSAVTSQSDINDA